MGSYNPFSFRFNLSPPGMFITRNLLRFCELFYLVPTGTCKVQGMLQQGGIGCASGGQTGTFTPMMLMVGQKPSKVSATPPPRFGRPQTPRS